MTNMAPSRPRRRSAAGVSSPRGRAGPRRPAPAAPARLPARRRGRFRLGGLRKPRPRTPSRRSPRTRSAAATGRAGGDGGRQGSLSEWGRRAAGRRLAPLARRPPTGARTPRPVESPERFAALKDEFQCKRQGRMAAEKDPGGQMITQRVPGTASHSGTVP
jgi:hypothetical protein